MNVLQIPKRTLLAAVAVSSFENEDIIQEKIFIDFKIWRVLDLWLGNYIK